MTNPNDRQVRLLSTSSVEQQDAVERLIQNSEHCEHIVPISPQVAFEEFVEDHADLLRRLAL